MDRESEYDVFLGYSERDRDRAELLVSALRSPGLRVFWAPDSIPSGVDFPDFLREKLRASRCVVVLWSDASVDSHWVEAEAREAQKRGVLLPVLIDSIDPDRLPFGLGHINAASLVAWDGSPESDAVKRLLVDIGKRCGPALEGSTFDHVATAGLSGMTSYGPVSYPGGPAYVEPEVVESFEAFEATFGGLAPLDLGADAGIRRIGYAAYAARAYFDSGGRKLIVSRVYKACREGGFAGDGIAHCDLQIESGQAAWRAQWPGSGGNVTVHTQVLRTPAIVFKNDVGVTQVSPASAGEVIEVLASGATRTTKGPLDLNTLRVVRAGEDGRQAFLGRGGTKAALEPDQQVNSLRVSVVVERCGRVLQEFGNLSTCPSAEDYIGSRVSRRQQQIPEEARLPFEWRQVWPLVWLDHQPAADFGAAELLASLEGARELAGGHDGALVSPSALAGEVRADGEERTGLASLVRGHPPYDEIDVLFLPDAGAYSEPAHCIEAAKSAVDLGARAIFIADAPRDATVGETLRFRERLARSTLVFHPWVEVIEGDGEQPLRLPPSGFVAGLYSAINPAEDPLQKPDFAHAPRTLRVRVSRPDEVLALEQRGIHCLQVADGCAALSGNEQLLQSLGGEDHVRFVRLVQYVEKSVRQGLLRRALFEPASEALAKMMQADAEHYLRGLWRAGALRGDQEEKAFRVEARPRSDDPGIDISLELSLPAPPPFGPRIVNMVIPVRPL